MTEYHSLVFIGVLIPRCMARVRSFSPNTQFVILLRHESGCGVGATMQTGAGCLDIHTVHNHSSLIHAPLVRLLFPLSFSSLSCSHEQIFTAAPTTRKEQPHWGWEETPLGVGGGDPPHPNNFLSDKELASKLLVSYLASNFPSLFYLLLKKE